jgi:hypothetical protein
MFSLKAAKQVLFMLSLFSFIKFCNNLQKQSADENVYEKYRLSEFN